ncbi:unnamed protein product [Thlaspi arvense]|uniref:Uncharacterized protein n=1 Tax=Thlaspi arvense TaxID=13288 RepID=A0AAU9RVX4_THLAR|nr:unnamed protein product [Thlaspi arvense]
MESRRDHVANEQQEYNLIIDDDDLKKLISYNTRSMFYKIATILVITILFVSIHTLWFDIANESTMYKLTYAFLGVATIPYIGLLVSSCMYKAVPVPSYRLGPDGRFSIYLATTIIAYCIACNIKDVNVMVELTTLAIMVVVGVIAIVQLYSPADDLGIEEIVIIMSLGSIFGILGCIAQYSWMSFFGTICISLMVMCIIKSWEQQRDHHRRKSLLPV